MRILEWLESFKITPESIRNQEQLENVLELAYKTGYKDALEEQIKAEPVAWEHTFVDGLKVYYPHKEYLDPRVKQLLPLYRYPPPREPLTEKQIDMLTDRYLGRGTVKPAYSIYRQYVRAVEKMHGIQ